MRALYLELAKGIDLCWEQRLHRSTLTLLYSGMDALAWLTCDVGQQDVERKDFINWVERYFLPGSNLPCTALDLYAARCGLLHSLTPDASIIRRRQARQIYYAVGPERATILQYAIDNSPEPAVAVQLDALVGAFHKAFETFFEDVRGNYELQRRAESRCSRVLATFVDSQPAGSSES